MAEEAAALAGRWAAGKMRVDANSEGVRLSLRVIGRAIFGDDVRPAGEVLDPAFPVLNGYVFRRAMSPVGRPHRGRPGPTGRPRPPAAALYGVVDG